MLSHTPLSPPSLFPSAHFWMMQSRNASATLNDSDPPPSPTRPLPPSPWTHLLPREIKKSVLSFLGCADLARVCLVSRLHDRLGSDPALWHALTRLQHQDWQRMQLQDLRWKDRLHLERHLPQVRVSVCVVGCCLQTLLGIPDFQVKGRGRVNRARKILGGGVAKRAQLTGPLISCYELWRRRCRNFF